jgi:lipoic acid synthetase
MTATGRQTGRSKKPDWLKRRLPSGPDYQRVRGLLQEHHLNTVCQEARCPNQFECYAGGTATFMIMGKACTRNCRFCAVAHGPSGPPDPDEPAMVARAVQLLGLRYAVVTSVTRDDLADGGASCFAETIRAIRKTMPATCIEVLIPDLGGDPAGLAVILAAGPQVLNHNIETVPRLYPAVRPEADYRRSLALLAAAKKIASTIPTKTGIMLGLGETEEELLAVFRDLRAVGCDILTLGQYLQPSPSHLPVVRFLPPAEFQQLSEKALDLGFSGVAAGPLVRSSYQAEKLYQTSMARSETSLNVP